MMIGARPAEGYGYQSVCPYEECGLTLYIGMNTHIKVEHGGERKKQGYAATGTIRAMSSRLEQRGEDEPARPDTIFEVFRASTSIMGWDRSISKKIKNQERYDNLAGEIAFAMRWESPPTVTGINLNGLSSRYAPLLDTADITWTVGGVPNLGSFRGLYTTTLVDMKVEIQKSHLIALGWLVTIL